MSVFKFESTNFLKCEVTILNQTISLLKPPNLFQKNVQSSFFPLGNNDFILTYNRDETPTRKTILTIENEEDGIT